MTRPDATDLRTRFAEQAEGARPREDCPPADTLWAAQAGEIDVQAREAVLDHLTSCASCAEDWRVTMETREAMSAALASASTEHTVEPGAVVTGGFPTRGSIWALAAALAMAIGLGWWLRTGSALPGDPAYRTGSRASIESHIEEGAVVGPGPIELRWEAVEGARYRVSVTDARLDALFHAEGLVEPRVVVPAERLDQLTGGERIWWRVEARLEDGDVVTMVPSWLRWHAEDSSVPE